jgi:hypothetical protein
MNKPFVEDKVRLHTVLPNASKLAYSYNRKKQGDFFRTVRGKQQEGPVRSEIQIRREKRCLRCVS